MKHILSYILSLPWLLMLTNCFTGVESTPKITFSDVKKEHIVEMPEQKFLKDITITVPKDWQPGKIFRVTDSKISLIFSNSANIDFDNLVGQDIIFDCITPQQSITGDEIAMIKLHTLDGLPLEYRTELPYAEINDKTDLDIPFTVNMEIVEQVRQKLLGQTYYIINPIWYDLNGLNTVRGVRYVPVQITDIEAGNSVYPLRIVFNPEDSGKFFSVYMTVGDKRTSTRNFHTLFAFENPRQKYPQISDDNWALISHSKVKNGMSRDECRLALGSPKTIGQRPTSAGMVEYWSYSDGIYLIFEEGYLSSYRR